METELQRARREAREQQEKILNAGMHRFHQKRTIRQLRQEYREEEENAIENFETLLFPLYMKTIFRNIILLCDNFIYKYTFDDIVNNILGYLEPGFWFDLDISPKMIESIVSENELSEEEYYMFLWHEHIRDERPGEDDYVKLMVL